MPSGIVARGLASVAARQAQRTGQASGERHPTRGEKPQGCGVPTKVLPADHTANALGPVLAVLA